jgi:hypothetical protein
MVRRRRLRPTSLSASSFELELEKRRYSVARLASGRTLRNMASFEFVFIEALRCFYSSSFSKVVSCQYVTTPSSSLSWVLSLTMG